jgi:hypothetical protein
MPEKRKYKDDELDRIHTGRGYKKGMKAEARRRLKEHQRGILALLVVFTIGALFGALVTRNKD